MNTAAPARDTLADLEELARIIPGCEVRPAPGSTRRCGAPSIGVFVCFAMHKFLCRVRRGTFTVWMCTHHRDLLAAGHVVCNDCVRPVSMVRIA